MTDANDTDKRSSTPPVAESTLLLPEKDTHNRMITVLLIDDSRSVRSKAHEFLVSAGYRAVFAKDGFEALAKVVEFKPDIIFADAMMPRLDGYQTCALLKNNAEYRSTPVVLLSGRNVKIDSERARLIGSTVHLAKPLSSESLVKAVSALVKK